MENKQRNETKRKKIIHFFPPTTTPAPVQIYNSTMGIMRQIIANQRSKIFIRIENNNNNTHLFYVYAGHFETTTTTKVQRMK